jgi:AcrR family transcriptional regulator
MMSERTTDRLPQRADEKRRDRILEAAEKVVLAYGYSRVTMDDLARATGISRPALYLEFRNKAEIYSAIAAQTLDHSAQLAEAILAGPGTLEFRLAESMQRAVFDLVARFRQTAHGSELLDLKNELAADLHAAWRERVGRAIAEAVAREGGAAIASRGLSPAVMAANFLAAIDGLKALDQDEASMAEAFRQLVRMMVVAIG